MEAVFIASSSTAGAAHCRSSGTSCSEVAGTSRCLSRTYGANASAFRPLRREWNYCQLNAIGGRSRRSNDRQVLKRVQRSLVMRVRALNLVDDQALGLMQHANLGNPSAVNFQHATDAVATLTHERAGASLAKASAGVGAAAAAAWAEVQPGLAMMTMGGGASQIGDESGSSRIAFELLSSACTASSSGATPAVQSTEMHVLMAAAAAVSGAAQDSVSEVAQFQQFGTDNGSEQDRRRLDRAINALMVAGAAIYATANIFTVDHDYWHGWTLYEIVRYAPVHNWSAYEQALQSNPVLAKMAISGIVYSLGDWIAQCCEGNALLDFKRDRMIRSGLVGFCLHGSLSHHYYHVCEALFPFKEWWVVPLKVAFDQTLWSGFWNSVYFVVLGLLRLESPTTIASNLKSTFWPLLTAGWKLWPFAHVITYGFVPLEQRLLWVDMVELVWVAILSLYSNQAPEARAGTDATDIDTLSSSSSGEDLHAM